MKKPSAAASALAFCLKAAEAMAETPPLRHDLVLIPGGSFVMGSPVDEQARRADERQHRVTVRDFYLSSHELTVGEFRAFVTKTGYLTDAERDGSGWVLSAGETWETKTDASWDNPYVRQAEDHPVVLVTWFDAVNYANWRSRAEGLTPAYGFSESGDGRTVTWDRGADGYRLPTEAEWEYAARAGADTPFSTGTTISAKQANFNGGLPYANGAKGPYRKATTPAGSFEPNALGLYDMHGNAFEWCWDWYGEYPVSDQIDPAGPDDGTQRIYRGGSWGQGGELLRAAYRRSNLPTARSDGLGFRLARNAKDRGDRPKRRGVL